MPGPWPWGVTPSPGTCTAHGGKHEGHSSSRSSSHIVLSHSCVPDSGGNWAVRAFCIQGVWGRGLRSCSFSRSRDRVEGARSKWQNVPQRPLTIANAVFSRLSSRVGPPHLPRDEKRDYSFSLKQKRGGLFDVAIRAGVSQGARVKARLGGVGSAGERAWRSTCGSGTVAPAHGVSQQANGRRAPKARPPNNEASLQERKGNMSPKHRSGQVPGALCHRLHLPL